MKAFVAVVVLGFGASCTKPNRLACCTDEADCKANGIPVGKGCDDGLVCRGNQCIAEICAGTNDCDPAAPYCVNPPDGRCAESCTSDVECPGFGQNAKQLFCVSGGCVQC